MCIIRLHKAAVSSDCYNEVAVARITVTRWKRNDAVVRNIKDVTGKQCHHRRPSAYRYTRHGGRLFDNVMSTDNYIQRFPSFIG